MTLAHSSADPSPGPAAIGAPAERRRGRGAATNVSGRFEILSREDFDDGWTPDEAPEPLATEVTWEKPKVIITRNQSPDIPFDRSINPYRGCEHGCFYCFARPIHAYMGLSPGLDFESRLFAKEGAAELLERELAAPKYTPATIALGTNTDPYQPIERRYRITRSLIETLRRARHPATIVTKSNLVLRDLDLLTDMARDGLVKVFLSVTTLDRALARKMEPRAPTPQKRLEAIEALNHAGVPAGVMVAPIIPAVNDAEIETILTRAYGAGAREGGYVVLRLPHELRDMFREWLQVHYPDRLKRAVSLMQSMREGKDYEVAMGAADGGLRALRLDDRPPVRDGRAPARLQRDEEDAARRPVPAAGPGRQGCAAQPVLTQSPGSASW